jgi:hypothetical protein
LDVLQKIFWWGDNRLSLGLQPQEIWKCVENLFFVSSCQLLRGFPQIDNFGCSLCMKAIIFYIRNVFRVQFIQDWFGFMVFWHHFQQYFSYIVAVSFIGGGNRSKQRKPPTCLKSQLYHIILYTSPCSEIGVDRFRCRYKYSIYFF